MDQNAFALGQKSGRWIRVGLVFKAQGVSIVAALSTAGGSPSLLRHRSRLGHFFAPLCENAIVSVVDLCIGSEVRFASYEDRTGRTTTRSMQINLALTKSGILGLSDLMRID